MRQKDVQKQQALYDATVKLVNEVGFAATSVSKIAKEAGVSPATLYIYHENKEELLVSVYVSIKKQMGQAMLDGFNPERPIRETIQRAWKNMLLFCAEHRALLRYTEQFGNSPFTELVDKTEINRSFEPVYQILLRGQQEQILKDLPLDILGAFIVQTMQFVANPKMCPSFQADDKGLEQVFSMVWDAIRR